MKKGSNKRGLSTVITTLILIAVSLVAIVGVGIFIKNFSQEKSEFITAEGLTLDVQISNVEVINHTAMEVKVKRNPGGNDISGVVFVIYDTNNSEVHRKNIPLEELERKNFEIILEVLNTSYVTKITVAPIFLTDSGKEIIGSNEAERVIRSSSGGGGSSSSSSDSVDDNTDPPIETCEDGISNQGEEGIDCGGPCQACSTDCDLTSAIWNPRHAFEGEEVSMTLSGTNCDGEFITLEIFDKDRIGRDFVVSYPLIFNEYSLCQECIFDPNYYWCPEENTCNLYTGYPTCITPFVSRSQGTCPTETPVFSTFSFIWEAVYEEESELLEDIDPEYYFTASVFGSAETIESSNENVNDPLLLIVEQIPSTCTDGIQNQDEEDIDCGGPCDACIIPNVYWQYDGNEVTVLNDIEYENFINLVLEDSGLTPGTGVDFEIYDYDSVGADDYLGTTSYYVGSSGNVVASWRFEEAAIGAARELVEGNRLELYFIANGIESPELDINFIEIIEETCTDGIQNQDEGGIDCGGSCGPCFNLCDACTRSGDVWCVIPGIDEYCVETELECDQNEGLIPINCETCFDGIHNQDEEGIDCGGVCKVCQTCEDGIQNQQELMIDCGGPNCPSCECIYGVDCPTGWDCVRGFCDKCDSTTSGYACSDGQYGDNYDWTEGTCVYLTYNEEWQCRGWASASYEESTGIHHSGCGHYKPNSSDGFDMMGWPCMYNEFWVEPSGDFVAEGLCVDTNGKCTSGEVAIHDGERIIDPSNADPYSFDTFYYEDCLRIGDPRHLETASCDNDVTSPTLGFFPNGQCYCGDCFTGEMGFDETPCIENYESLDFDLVKQLLLDRINWERNWLGNSTVKGCNDQYGRDCYWNVYPINEINSLDPELSEIARLHSKDMADNKYIIDAYDATAFWGAHNAEGLRTDERIAEAGYSKECPYPVAEVTDRIYIYEGMDEYELVDHLLYGGPGDTYGHWLSADPWFGNLHRYYGEGPRYLGDEWESLDGSSIYWMYGNFYWYDSLADTFIHRTDEMGMGFAMAEDGRLYITVTGCDTQDLPEEEIKTYPYHEDWRCSFNVNRPEWCDCNYNNDERCYFYYAFLEDYGSEDAMEVSMVSLRNFCEGGIYDQDLDLVCSDWNPFNEISWEYGGSEVTEINSISVPSVLTLRVQSQRLVEGETHSFEIYDEDSLGDDHLGTVSGTVEAFGSNNYVISATWTFDQDAIDDADNWGEGDTLELYFTLLDVESDILEVGPI